MNGQKDRKKHPHYNPKHRGPGNWDALHSIAHYCDIKENYSAFIISLRAVIYGFKCLECREHAIKYINKNPPDVIYYKYSINNKKYPFDRHNIRIKYPCSYYMNMFHNFVSGRLKKPLYDLSESIKKVTEGCNDCIVNIIK